MSVLVEAEHLTRAYGGVRALDDLSFSIEAGEWIAIMGPSGSGKTTLVNIIGGLDAPTGGRVLVDGSDIGAMDENALTRYRAEKIGFVFQQFHLVPYLTALENVMLAQYFHSMTDEREAQEALARVGLAERATHLPAQLSGGEQQRVAIARALINHPKLILADEPTGNLDEANERIVVKLLRELHTQGHTILLVTHDPSIGRLADRRIELAHGRLTQITVYSADDQERFDHMLQQIWICGEEGTQARPERLRMVGQVDLTRMLGYMAASGLVAVQDSEVLLTSTGETRARDIVRRHRLAERLFTDTFRIDDPEAHTQACKFEHIISPELDARICTFLNHPKTCPHGNPIPPGECCTQKTRG